MPQYHPLLAFEKVIRLPEYGYVGITSLEKLVIDTLPMQRLRRIKQLSNAHLLYPGATHTRFEHSLGVMYLAGEALWYTKLNETHIVPINKWLSKNQIENKIDDLNEFARDLQLIRLMGLLHDCGHGPFSHTYEMFHRLINKEFNHENYTRKIIYTNNEINDALNDTSNEFSIDKKDLLAIYANSISTSTERNLQFTRTMVSFFSKVLNLSNDEISKMQDFLNEKKILSLILRDNLYNVDRMNYLILDSNRCGTVEYGSIDALRLIQNIYFVQNHLYYGKKAKNALIRYLEAYLHMYYNVYMHRFTRAADVHVALMLKYAYELKGVQDNPVKSFVEPDLETLLSLTDDVVLHILSNLSKNSQNAQLTRLVNQFLRRQIIKEVDTRASLEILKDFHSLDEYSEHLKKIYRLPHDAIIFAVPLSYPSPAPNPLDSGAPERYALFDSSSGSIISSGNPEFTEFIHTISKRTESREVLKIYVERKYAPHVLHMKRMEEKKQNHENHTTSDIVL